MSQEFQNWLTNLTATIQPTSGIEQSILEHQRLPWDLIPQSRFVCPNFCTVARLTLNISNWRTYPCTLNYEDAMVDYPHTDKPTLAQYNYRAELADIHGSVCWPSYLHQYELPKINQQVLEDFFKKCHISFKCLYSSQYRNSLSFSGRAVLFGNLWPGILAYADQMKTWNILRY